MSIPKVDITAAVSMRQLIERNDKLQEMLVESWRERGLVIKAGVRVEPATLELLVVGAYCNSSISLERATELLPWKTRTEILELSAAESKREEI